MPSEARMIHRALFPGRSVPDVVVSRYGSARARFFARDGAAELVRYLAERGLDAEAVEYVLRLRHGGNGLTRRFQVMLTLCEVRPGYDGAFVQRRAGRWRAWAGAPWLVLRSGWKLARGVYLLRAHGLDRMLDV